MGLIKSFFYGLEKSARFLHSMPTPEERQAMTDRFLYGYGDRFHCTNDQYFRFCRSMDPEKIGRVVLLDKKRMKMWIKGSYHPERTYNVRLDRCDCMDFKERHLPCKHIYRLALELGIVTPEWDLSGITPEVREMFSALSEAQEKALLRLIKKQGARGTEFDTGRGTVPSALVNAGFIDEAPQSMVIGKNFKKQELLSILSSSDSCPVSYCDKKENIIDYIVQSQPKLAKTLSEKFYRVKYSEILFGNLEFIRRYLEQKYE